MPRPRGESAPPAVDCSIFEDLHVLSEANRRYHEQRKGAQQPHHPHPQFTSELGTVKEEDDELVAKAATNGLLLPPPRDQFLSSASSSPASSPAASPQVAHKLPITPQAQAQAQTQAQARVQAPPLKTHAQSDGPRKDPEVPHFSQYTTKHQPHSQLRYGHDDDLAVSAAGAPSASRRTSSKDFRYPAAISDHYDVAFTIGEGAFAKVKIACHKLTGVRVAIKVIYKARLIRDSELYRAYDEVEVLKRLRHKNIVRLFQVVDTPDRLYIVMEYLPNGELFDYIVANDRIRNEKEAKWIFYQAVKAVQYCHKHGIAHRDLKPENLLLGERMVTKLCDFGLIGPSGASVLKTSCGSENYTAPEILAGKGYLGEIADIWSLGVVLFAMVSGYLPFDHDDPVELRRLIDSACYIEPRYLSLESRSLIRAILQPNPDHRPSINEILDHPWLRECHGRDVPSLSDLSLESMMDDPVGQAALIELATYYGVATDIIVQLLRKQLYDHLQADFELLVLAKMRKTQVHLPAQGGRLENIHRVLPPTPLVLPVAAPVPTVILHEADGAGGAAGSSTDSQPQLQTQQAASQASGASGASSAESGVGSAGASPKTQRRRMRAASSPLKADAAAASSSQRRDVHSQSEAEQVQLGQQHGGPLGGQQGHHYLKFMNPGSWRSLANSIRQKVSSLREQRNPKVVGPASQVNIRFDLSPESVRDAVQHALVNLEGARTKSRGFRFHTTVCNPRLFPDEVRLLIEVCSVFGEQKTETGIKISRVKGEMTSCVTASREIVQAARTILEGASATPKNAPAEEGLAVRGSEEEGRRRAHSDAPQKLPPQYRKEFQASAAAAASSSDATVQRRATASAATAAAASASAAAAAAVNGTSHGVERSTSSSSSSSERTPTPPGQFSFVV